MTGLDHRKGVILEIATVVTDSALEVLAEGPNLAIHHSEEVLEDMEEWSREHHQASGILVLVTLGIGIIGLGFTFYGISKRLK